MAGDRVSPRPPPWHRPPPLTMAMPYDLALGAGARRGRHGHDCADRAELRGEHSCDRGRAAIGGHHEGEVGERIAHAPDRDAPPLEQRGPPRARARVRSGRQDEPRRCRARAGTPSRRPGRGRSAPTARARHPRRRRRRSRARLPRCCSRPRRARRVRRRPPRAATRAAPGGRPARPRPGEERGHAALAGDDRGHDGDRALAERHEPGLESDHRQDADERRQDERALRRPRRVEEQRERCHQERAEQDRPKTTKAPTRRTACASTGSGAPQPIAAASPKKIVSTRRGYGKRAPCVAPCCVAAS